MIAGLSRLRNLARPARFPAPVLLHIGVPKSATTALQNGLAGARAELAEGGVLYPDLDGRINHHQLAIQLMGRRHQVWNPTGDSDEQIERLRELAEEPGVRQVVLSSELLAEGDRDDAKRALAPFGRDVHVLITLRSLPQLLLSSWTQGASTGSQIPFEEWLQEVLRDPESLDMMPLLTFRGDDGYNLITRWASLVGAKNITVLIPDPADRTSVFTEAESLLGVRQGMLPHYSSNKSLTFLQAEYARLTGAATRSRVNSHDRVQLVQLGLGNGMKRGAGDSGPRPALPDWAAAAADRAAAALRREIESAGLTVIGDLGDLAGSAPSSGSTRYAEPTSLPIELVTDGLEGLFKRSRHEPYAIARAMEPVSKPRKLPPLGSEPSGTVGLVPVTPTGDCGLGSAVEAAARRLGDQGGTSAEPGDAAAPALALLPALPPTPEAATEGTRLLLAVEPAAVAVRRAYQDHLIAGGADSWDAFCAAFAAPPVPSDEEWVRAGEALRATGAVAGVIRLDGNIALEDLVARTEGLLELEAGALGDVVRWDPHAALLDDAQLALLRAFNERTWTDNRGVHYARLVVNGLVSASLAATGQPQAPLSLPAAMAASADAFDEGVARMLEAAGLDAPARGEALAPVDLTAITEIPTAQAVAAARGMVFMAHAAGKRIRARQNK